MGSTARFNGLHQIAANTSNDQFVYLSDSENNAIRRADSTNKTATIVTTYMSGLNYIKGLIFTSDLQFMYYSLSLVNQLVKIQVNSVTIIATYGTGRSYVSVVADIMDYHYRYCGME